MNKLKKILVIGSGPIVIGQAAEFDYSGTQACRAFREEGLKVVLVNSNPATIQTDPEIADAVYIEPLTLEFLERIIERERPDAIFGNVGGQTGLNLTMELWRKGILEKYGVEVIGTGPESIEKGESRDMFIKAMKKIKQPILQGKPVKSLEEGLEFVENIGYPLILRPAYTLGGTGGGVAENEEEFKELLERGLRLSPTNEVLVERSVVGWGEFEYEVVRDSFGNKIIVCNMENFDPMGVHTGESIVVAPSQTLSDKEHQNLRDASFAIVDELGIVGGCNVQFAFNQNTGDYYVIEVNPRLSRSSALASKATGFPIARIAAKLALGHKLYEIKNAVTQTTPASFEPSLDYVVVKIPRWPFDKFPHLDRKIGTQMKSTGEVMAIGRTFEESLQKAIRSLDTRLPKLEDAEKYLMPPTDLRLFAILEIIRKGRRVEEIGEKTGVNLWFLHKLKKIVEFENRIRNSVLSKGVLQEAKKMGFSDAQIGALKGLPELEIRKIRKEFGIVPTYKMVDTVAGEFEAKTPYFYSTYESENESVPLEGKKVIIIGSGPIRIGQGIEFDYCTVHASFSLRKMGMKSIVINNNPETVSTDFDVSDRLYFEPLTFEDVMNIVENEGAETPLLVQYGGQTAINIAAKVDGHAKILGTSMKGIDAAEDRDLFRTLALELGILQPANATATNEKEALEIAEKITYPVVVRPSYVIAGRAMQIIHSPEELKRYINEAVEVSEKRPVLIDKYLDNAIECEVDGVSDGERVEIAGIMEHIEYAGVHSGDANIVYPSIRLSSESKEKIKDYSEKLCRKLGIVGFFNIQFAVRNGTVFVLEVNPRASRTLPFISKARGVNFAKLATEAMCGIKMEKVGKPEPAYYSVKSVVFPFVKLPGLDSALGPEMKSTGESMGISSSYELAYYKALVSAGLNVKKNAALVSLKEKDKEYAGEIEKRLSELGFEIYATPGTAKYMKNPKKVDKIGQGKLDVLGIMDKIGLVVNTPSKGGKPNTDGFRIRRAALDKGIACITEINAALAYIGALEKVKERKIDVERFDEY
ncbi:carbamoyl-phosphate synthase large subunit [Candidatus Micrarchaeota archaeon]|nr:carbamoyl-phosphate synthase large subunit [Candidatus Micrarchaeota archaeon]